MLFNEQKPNFNKKKSIVIYFSRADENYSVGFISKGNTEVIAEYIKDITSSDIFKVERKIDYAKDYQNAIEEAKQEQMANLRPELKEYLDDISEYETIYIGVPVYYGTMPQPMFTELERLNFTGKIVKPFTTHEGSGLGNVVSDLRKICVGATVLEGLAIYGHDVNNAKEIVEEWIKR